MLNVKNAKTASISIAVFLALGSPALAKTDTAAQLLAEGNSAANAGDFNKALDLFQKACAKKSDKACEYVGFIQSEGHNGSVNLDAASTAFNKSCEMGNVFSCSKVKSIKKYRQEVATLDAGCAKDDGEACNSLAQLHMIWKTEDAATNRSNFSKSCGLGYQDGCYNYSIMLRDGKGGKRDIPLAKAGFEKLCAVEHVKACDSAKKLENMRVLAD